MSSDVPRSGSVLTAATIAAGAVGMLALHVVAPAGPITWSYAHLDRHPALPLLAVLVAVAAPLGGAWLWRQPWAAEPVAPIGWRRAGAIVALATVVGVAVGLLWPVTPICIDAWYFAKAVADETTKSPRWYLTVWVFARVAAGLHGMVEPIVVARACNSAVMVWALAALASVARTLGRTNGEALVLLALPATAFGILQLALGYIDVYPTAVLLTALYLWAAGAVLVRDRHPVWAAAAVVAAPFFYVGLVLLVPSLAVVLWTAGRRQGWRRVGVALGAGVAVAGLATVPGYGTPFAWLAFARDLRPALAPGAPIDGRGMLMQVPDVVAGDHWIGLAHLLLLVDGVGCLLLTACTPQAFRRMPAAVALWGMLFLGPALAYLVTMDPLFGVFADWDLFSWVAVLTAVAGAFAFVVWGRTESRGRVGGLAGLVLAASIVHLLARLNGLHLDFHRHLAETPFRVPVAGAPSTATTGDHSR